MICKHCHAQNTDDAKFCTACGQLLDQPAAQQSQARELHYDYQMPPQQINEKDGSGFAIASFVIALGSFVCCCAPRIVTGILSVIFGILGLRSRRRGLAIAGIAVGVFLFVVSVIVLIYELTGGAPKATFDFSNGFDWHSFNDIIESAKQAGHAA